MNGRYRIHRVLAATLLGGLISIGCAARYESAMGSDLRETRGGLSFEEEPPPLDEEELAVGQSGPEGYILYALRVHPGLRASYERWRATTLRISSARRLPEPVVSYAYFVQSVETRVGPQRHRLSVRQTFPWPTKLTAGADAVSLRARAMQRRFDARALLVRSTVEERYWSLWMVRAVRDVRREQAVILSDLSDAVRGRIEVGSGSLADVQQIDVARARLDDSIDALDEQERQGVALLIESIGAPTGSPAPTQDTHPPTALPAEELAALQSAVRDHPMIESFAHLAESSEAEAARAEADRFPNFMVGLDWIETGDALMPVQGSGTDPVIVSVGVSIPLYQPIYDEAQRAFEADAEAHQADGREATNRALAQLEVLLSRVRDSERRVSLHRSTLIPQALTTYESVLGAYSAGRGSVAALLLAQQDLLELRESLVHAEADHVRAWAGLDATVGRTVERASHEDDGGTNGR